MCTLKSDLLDVTTPAQISQLTGCGLIHEQLMFLTGLLWLLWRQLKNTIILSFRSIFHHWYLSELKEIYHYFMDFHVFKMNRYCDFFVFVTLRGAQLFCGDANSLICRWWRAAVCHLLTPCWLTSFSWMLTRCWEAERTELLLPAVTRKKTPQRFISGEQVNISSFASLALVSTQV